MNTEQYCPVRVMEEDFAGYIKEDKFEMEYAPRKISIPKDLTKLDGFPVVRSNIDTNNHVNNGQYIKMAEEFLPSGFCIRQMRAEYRKSAVLGDIITPMTYMGNDTFTVVLAGTDGSPFTIIEFKR
jgi:acyl-ACP thioesterase